VSKLHPDTVNRRDYSSFKLTAWCFNHEPVPAAMDLVIVEPPVFTEDGEHLKRALCYPISISMSPAPPTSCGGASPPPPEKDHDNRGGPSHHRRRTSNASDSRGSSTSSGVPVQTRLGRGAGGSHVAPNEAASEEAIPTVNSIAAGAPAGRFENASGHPGGFEDLAAAVISPTGGTSPSFMNLMIEHSELGPMIASLHDCEAVVLFAGAKLSAGA
jgi:hypothetical protein